MTDDWTSADTVAQGAVTALLIADWGQTRYIALNPQDWHEKNSLLGEHPSSGKVNDYFAAAIVGHAAISYLLPKDLRHGWQYVWIGIEANTVQNNRSLGIRMQF